MRGVPTCHQWRLGQRCEQTVLALSLPPKLKISRLVTRWGLVPGECFELCWPQAQVLGLLNWQEYYVGPTDGLTKREWVICLVLIVSANEITRTPEGAKDVDHLGLLGMNGLTAYFVSIHHSWHLQFSKSSILMFIHPGYDRGWQG